MLYRFVTFISQLALSSHIPKLAITRETTRNAFKVVVDIDQNELDKDTMDLQLKIHSDAGKFIDMFNEMVDGYFSSMPAYWNIWLLKCKEWQQNMM